MLNKLHAIQEISNDTDDMPTFYAKFQKACKILHYDACSKDYMANPKDNGYQSFHIRINTPFGPYEKQFRTDKQHSFAEKGNASHSLNYKPDVKTAFHRLKVPSPFIPKRDSHGDIISPTELGVAPFEHAVAFYYGIQFSTFADGKNFEDFQSQFSTKEDFDQALLDLSPTDNNFMTKLLNKFFKKSTKGKSNDKTQFSLDSTQSFITSVPSDIAVYADDENNSLNYDSSLFSNPPSDPHSDGNRYI